MFWNRITSKEIALEIQLQIQQMTGVRLTEKKVLSYMRNPKKYRPPAEAIQKWQNHWHEIGLRFPAVIKKMDLSVAGAVTYFRGFFSKDSQRMVKRVVQTRRDARAARNITGADLAKRFNALAPR